MDKKNMLLRLAKSRMARFEKMTAVFFWALYMEKRIFVLPGAMFLMLFFYMQHAVAGVNIPNGGRYLVNDHLVSDSGASLAYYHIVQDSRGLIYAGGQHGVYQYDGVSWRSIQGSGDFVISYLAIDKNDRVYVGGSDDFGYIDTNGSGQPYYQSIAKGLVGGNRASEFIWSIHIQNNQVIFIGDRAIYIWREGRPLFIIDAGRDNFSYSFFVDGRVLFQISGRGLFQIEQGVLVPYLEGDFFKDKHIMMVETFKNGLLIATLENGLYFYDGMELQPFKTKADHLIAKNGIIYGKKLRNGQIALGASSHEGGVIFIDEAGNFLNHIALRDGLRSGQVNFIEQDHEGNLWLALSRGVAHIELESVRFFDETHGVIGIIYSVAVNDNDMYIASSEGILKLNKELESGNAYFTKINDKYGNCYNMIQTPKGLMASCRDAIYHVDDHLELVHNSQHQLFNWIVPANQRADKIIVCHSRGLGMLSLENGQWVYRNLFPDQINMSIYNLLKENEMSFWFDNSVDGVVNILFPKGLSQPPVIRYFDESHGLPEGNIEITIVNGNALFLTKIGVFEFDWEEKNTQYLFKRSKVTPEELNNQYMVVGQGDNERVWAFVHKDITKPVSNTNRLRFFWAESINHPDYKWNELFVPVPNLLKNTWVDYWSGDHILLSSSDRLYQVDLNKDRYLEKPVKPLLRQIKSTNAGSVLYGGSKQFKILELSYEEGSLLFEYAYPYFSVKERNSYQYQLQGYNNQWSDWGLDTRKEYTDLKEGKYQFKIRARNVYGDITESDAFTFVINAPWYRAWYAYIAYVVLFLAFFYLVIELYTQALRKKASYLEGVVKQRTARIESLLKAKNTLFSNVSHEFRTPLTLIQGPITELMEQNKNPKQQSLLKIVQRNTRRLLNMVEQLLSVARIESPNEQEQKVYELSTIIRLQLDSLQALIKEKQLSFHIELAESVYISAMPDALETMSLNLLTNAIKYTPSGGSVWINLNCDNGRAYLSVKDNGLGIAEQNHESIFKRFVRIDNEGNRQIQGTGLGLAMVKELVELHQGSIRVKSALGQGAEFVLNLPLAAQHQSGNAEKVVGEISQIDTSVNLVLSELQEQNEEGLEQASQAKPQLLIIEDTADMRDYLYSILQAKYDCLLANDGETGLRLAKANLPDLIISDVMMLGMDGFQVLQAIRETALTSHIPLILLTAKGDEESRLRGINQLADDYIAKPFEKNLLLARISNLLAVRALLRNALAQQFQREEYPQAQYQKVLGEQKQGFVKQFHQLIEGNFRDEGYSVIKMADSLNVSVRQLQKKLKSELGRGPKEYLVTFRLKLAAKYLKDTELSVLEISTEVGFASPSHFANTFKAYYGISASEFRDQQVSS